MKDISIPINKVDNDEKTSGKALYTADIKMEGMLYAFTLRAAISHGEIKDITYPDLPEGYFIVDHKDVPGKNIVKVIFNDMPIFTDKKITYLYEPIALVIGPDKNILSKIIDEIKITYKEEKPVFDWVDSVINYHFDKGEGIMAFENQEIIEYDYETS
ncbi:MAG: hypothetical protein RBR66_04390, partial [Candidatus Izemoplasmatales bacterium]|nr:hypothetical protein [Candidatus Izemoplasmatales bacterium]